MSLAHVACIDTHRNYIEDDTSTCIDPITVQYKLPPSFCQRRSLRRQLQHWLSGGHNSCGRYVCTLIIRLAGAVECFVPGAILRLPNGDWAFAVASSLVAECAVSVAVLRIVGAAMSNSDGMAFRRHRSRDGGVSSVMATVCVCALIVCIEKVAAENEAESASVVSLFERPDFRCVIL